MSYGHIQLRNNVMAFHSEGKLNKLLNYKQLTAVYIYFL